MAVAYLTSRFPMTTETFIYREIVAVEAEGVAIRPFALFPHRGPTAHQPELDRMGHPFTVVASEPRAVAASMARLDRAERRTLRAVVRHIGRARRRDPKALAKDLAVVPLAVALRDQLRAAGVRHVHAHFATYPALAAWVVHQLDPGITYSVTCHAHDLYVDQGLLGTKLAEAELVVCISEFNRRFIAPYLDEAADPPVVDVVRCGIDVDRFAPEPTSPEGVADDGQGHEGGDDGALRVLSVGQLETYKGHDVLVRAIARLRDQGTPVRCRIVGEGSARAELERLIATSGLDREVALLGARGRDEVLAELHAADLFCLASRRTASGKMEGIPVAIMEASACGLPVVASDLSGISELVHHGTTGLLVAPDDPVALADALARVGAERSVARRMGEAGRKFVGEAFSLRTNAERLAGHLRATTEELVDA